MLYMHDVWVNWFEGEENGYNICHYHEWRKDDPIEILDQVPVIHVTDALFEYIENDMHELPRTLLDTIYKRAYIRKGPERIIQDYTAIVTNGKEIIVFDTMGYHIPIRKSRLIPRQEQVVYSLIEKTKPQTFKFNKKQMKKEHHILSLHPQYMFGLTRRERHLKHLLMIALDQIREPEHVDELRYWMTEWKPEHYPYLLTMETDEIWNSLYMELKEGWSDFHEEILHKMVKSQPFLEKLWKLEHNEEQASLNEETL